MPLLQMSWYAFVRQAGRGVPCYLCRRLTMQSQWAADGATRLLPIGQFVAPAE
jgi:hypothetical protein